jgi:gliding motility-associated-like protein
VVSEAALERAFEIMEPGCAGVSDGLIVPAQPLPPDWSPYRWTLNGQDANWVSGAAGLPAGQYLSALTDSRGCTFRDTLVLEAPTAWTLVLTSDQTILAGDTVVLSAQVIPPIALQYQWTPAARLNCDTCIEVRAWPDLSQVYQLFAIDDAGCEQRAEVRVTVLPRPHNYYAPTAFSPNDDGVNDRWRLYGEEGEYMVSRLQIYHRWGGLVYEISDADPAQGGWGWSGSARGQACESGVYLYYAVLRFSDGKVIAASGEIQLIR